MRLSQVGRCVVPYEPRPEHVQREVRSNPGPEANAEQDRQAEVRASEVWQAGEARLMKCGGDVTSTLRHRTR
jgi:hypothetical protein